MKHPENNIITAFRFIFIALTLLFLLTAVGCRDITHQPERPIEESRPALGTETTGTAQNTDTPNETTKIPETETSTIPETETPTIPETETSTIPETETSTIPEITDKPTETTKCDHTHSEEFDSIVDDLLLNNVSNDEILHTKEYLNSNRLVIAYGGLNLRNNPGVAIGTPVGLIPDGEIIPVLDRKDGWVYTTYNGINGWCSMEYLFDIFTNPSAGGAPIFSGTVTNANGCKLTVDRHCAAKPAVTTTIPHSTKVYIYMQDDNRCFVQYNNIWGYCQTSDLSVRPFDPTTEPPEPPKQEFTKTDLIGSWSSAHRDNETLYTCTLTFNENGTFKRLGLEYYHPHYQPFGEETDWYIAPMGHPSAYGYYGLDGDLLVMTYTGSDVEEYAQPHVITIRISSLKNGKLITDDAFELYIKDSTDMDLISLCDTIGVDRTVG